MVNSKSTQTSIKLNKIDIPIGFIGSHVQALPKETLEKETSIDFIFLNEGVYALHEIHEKKIFIQFRVIMSQSL